MENRPIQVTENFQTSFIKVGLLCCSCLSCDSKILSSNTFATLNIRKGETNNPNCTNKERKWSWRDASWVFDRLLWLSIEHFVLVVDLFGNTNLLKKYAYLLIVWKAVIFILNFLVQCLAFSLDKYWRYSTPINQTLVRQQHSVSKKCSFYSHYFLRTDWSGWPLPVIRSLTTTESIRTSHLYLWVMFSFDKALS